MIKERIREDMKAAMRAHDADRLSTIRLLLAAVKQREIDEKIEATDAQVTEVIAKMVKQRRDSIQQYRAGGREDLAQKEQAEIELYKLMCFRDISPSSFPMRKSGQSSTKLLLSLVFPAWPQWAR